MRILIAGPPKTGNMWLKCLLGQIYKLRWLLAGDIPDRPETPLFTEWAAAGRFPDGTIFHQHYEYSDELADAADRVPAHLVSIIRDPYDAFVSTYFTMQHHNPETAERPRKRSDLYGKDLHGEEVLQMLKEGGYLGNLMRAEAWLRSGRAHVLRYEDLSTDPVGTLTKLTDALGPASQDAITAAVAHCSADAMRQRGRRSGASRPRRHRRRLPQSPDRGAPGDLP